MYYVIEARTADGVLDFSVPDPSTVFGGAAITGISEDAMAKAIFRRVPDAVLSGDRIATWPALLHPRWIARPKTW